MAMASHIRLSPAAAALRIVADGVEIGRTAEAVILTEGSYPPVTYVPRADMDMTRLIRSEGETTCPWKGKANYFSIQTETGVLENAVWTYETPIEGMEQIAGHLAFYTDKVQIEA